MAAESERSGSGRATAIGAAALTTAVVAVIAVLLLNRPADPAADGEAGPTVGSSAAGSPLLSASPIAAASSSSVEPTPSATLQPTAGWQEAATFGEDGFNDVAVSVARSVDGFVAVGTHFVDQGPLVAGPAEGRVWFSADGRSWQDVTPSDTFVGVMLTNLIATVDGALIVHGYVQQETGPYSAAAWESADGRVWRSIAYPFPAGSAVSQIVRGGRGYLALGYPEVWLSSDGRSWETVQVGNPELVEFRSIAAGDDGFVVLGSRIDGVDRETVAFASADGREWIEAEPPMSAYSVIPRGGDWMATGTSSPVCGDEPGNDPIWSSADGLDWTEIGQIPWHPVEMRTDPECWAATVDLHSAGPWLIASPRAGYACCDNPLINATQQLSRDGRIWEALSLPPVDEDGLGSRVIDAIAEGDMLILVGHSGNQVTFWFNEAP